jgi:Integrase core domain
LGRHHDVERITCEYVHWYNNDRLHGYPDGYHTPEEYKRIHYTQQPGAPTSDAANKRRHENRDGSDFPLAPAYALQRSGSRGHPFGRAG